VKVIRQLIDSIDGNINPFMSMFNYFASNSHRCILDLNQIFLFEHNEVFNMKMNYSHYRNKYINLLLQPNIPDWKKFEYAVALNQSMIVWSDIPPNFGELYNLPHLMDYGIDCINLEYTKTIQVKHYKTSNITWKLMSTYIAYSSHILGINDMNLVTTPTANVTSIVKRSFPNMLRFTLDELIANLPELPKVEKPVKVIEQRPYTVECANLFLQSNQDIMRFELPCGMGKSYIIYEIIKKSAIDAVHLIISPWIDLSHQMMNELEEFGIKAALMGDGYNPETLDDIQVLVCVTASAKKLAKMDFTFGYKFIDEAHHVEKLESKQLEYINCIECERELHLSATFRKIHPLDYCMNLRDAIDGGWLSDYRIYIEYFGKGEMFSNVVQLVKSNPDWFPMFVYFNTTERAIEFAKEVGGEYLIGTCSRAKRARIVDDLNNYRCHILALCGCFNEGISINNLATVVFGDYRFSKINRIQIAMRASRLHCNKPFSRLVFPICKGGFDDKDLQEMIRSFSEIDPKLSHSMRNNGTRVSITNRNEKAEMIPAEFICEKIYDRFGELIGRLSTEEKIDEFLVWVEKNNCLPTKKLDGLFSDGARLDRFIGHHINHMNNYPYSKLLKNNIIKEYYDKYINKSKLTADEKINEFISWVEKNNRLPTSGDKDNFTDGVNINGYWMQCKTGRKLDKSNYNALNNNKLIFNAYQEYIEKVKLFKPKISVDDRTQEFLKWVELNKCLPKRNMINMFSDGCCMNKFWGKCKSKKKLDKKPYNILLSNDIIKNNYDSYLLKLSTKPQSIILTIDQKNNEFIEWCIKHNRIPSRCEDRMSNGIKFSSYWSQLGRKRKLDKPEYSKLLELDIIKNSYNNLRIKNIESIGVEKKIDEFIEWVKVNNYIPHRNCKDLFSDKSKIPVFWRYVKFSSKCDAQPYMKLLDIDVLKKDYERTAEIKNKNNKFLSLSNSDKINEFIKWIEFNKCIPTANCDDKFSDGTKIGGFWVSCKSYNKLDKPEYFKLLNINILKEDYNNTLEKQKNNSNNKKLPISIKIDEFIEWVNTNRSTPVQGKTGKHINYFSDGTKIGLFWSNCKNKSKCNNQPYIRLLDNPIIKENYIDTIQTSKPEELSKFNKVNQLLNYVNKKGIPSSSSTVKFKSGMTLCEYWDDIKKNKKCIEWPYIELLNNQLLKDDYNHQLFK
jgi:hypothetical protein